MKLGEIKKRIKSLGKNDGRTDDEETETVEVDIGGADEDDAIVCYAVERKLEALRAVNEDRVRQIVSLARQIENPEQLDERKGALEEEIEETKDILNRVLESLEEIKIDDGEEDDGERKGEKPEAETEPCENTGETKNNARQFEGGEMK